MSDEYPLMAFIANEGVAPKGERYDRSALVTDTVNKLYKKTEKGDFIYSSNNLETGSIGLNKYGKACISPVYSIFEPTGIADSDFLGRRLVRKDFINAMVKWRQGVIYGQWRIHESDFLKIEIPVPSVEEQRKIGAYLDQLDNLITLHQRQHFLHSTPDISLSVRLIHPFYTSSWEQRKVGDLLIERNQQAPMSDEYPLMAFIANEGVAPKGERYDRSALVTDTVNKLYKKTEKGDFIYSSNNLETGSIGLNKYGKACISPVYSIFEPTGIADSDFLGRRLVRKDFINAMVKWRQGVIYGQWRIHESDFLKIEIPVPSVEEQRKIGAYLDQLDNLITLHQRQHFLHSTPDISLSVRLIHPFYTSSWEQRKLGDVVQITMGQSPDGSTYSDEPSDYILVQGNADLQNGWVCPRIWTTQITKKADAGDLIMSVRAPAGAMGKTAYNAVIGRGVAAIKGNEFIYQLLVKMDMDGFWKTLSCGSTFESLNSDNIKNAEVKVPTTAEQVQIGDFFRHLDNLITLHQRKGKAAVSGCSNDANNSKGVCCKARDFGYKCHKKDEPNRFDA